MNYDNVFYVKILPKSVKKNPNAGQTTFYEKIGPSLITITITCTHEPINNDKNIFLLSRSVDFLRNISKSEYKFFGDYDNAEKLLTDLSQKYKEHFSYSIENNCQEIHTLAPSPQYLFKYRKTRVKCSHCRTKFSYTELKSEDDYDYEGNYFGRANICPKCDGEDCCRLFFETIGDFLLKEKGIPKYVTG